VTASRPHPAWVTTAFDLEDLQRVLDVQLVAGDSSTVVTSLPTAHGGVLGAQLLGQMVSACESASPGKSVSTLTMHFLRSSRWQDPLHVHARRLSDGRRFSVLQVDFTQGDRHIARGEALLSEAVSTSDWGHGADQTARRVGGGRALWPWDVDDSSSGAGELDVWARIPSASGDAREGRALLAYATESLTIPLAIDRRGLRGVGGRVPQAVVSHSVSFASPLDVRQWHRHRSEVVSHGGTTVVGRGEVVDEGGRRAVLTHTIAMVDTKNERLLADR
jgi:acyl-CoA thioesterase-2